MSGPDKIGLKVLDQDAFLFRWSQAWSLRAMRVFLHAWCGLRFKGRKYVEGSEACILAPTHASHLDFWAVLAGLPPVRLKKTYVAAAQDFFYRPPLRRLATHLFSYHNFPLQREPLSWGQYQRMRCMLQSGLSLMIFGQGTRSRDGRLLPFKPMLAALAIECRVPVIPVAVKGTFAVLPAGKVWPKRRPIEVCFGAPLSIVWDGKAGSQPLSQAVRQLQAQLQQSIQRLWQD